MQEAVHSRKEAGQHGIVDAAKETIKKSCAEAQLFLLFRYSGISGDYRVCQRVAFLSAAVARVAFDSEQKIIDNRGDDADVVELAIQITVKEHQVTGSRRLFLAEPLVTPFEPVGSIDDHGK